MSKHQSNGKYNQAHWLQDRTIMMGVSVRAPRSNIQMDILYDLIVLEQRAEVTGIYYLNTF